MTSTLKPCLPLHNIFIPFNHIRCRPILYCLFPARHSCHLIIQCRFYTVYSHFIVLPISTFFSFHIIFRHHHTISALCCLFPFDIHTRLNTRSMIWALNQSIIFNESILNGLHLQVQNILCTYFIVQTID